MAKGENVVDSFEARVLCHLPALYNLARWLTGNEADAQDLVQESVIRAMRSMHQLRTENARAWLLAIARNAFFTDWRESGRRRAGEVPFDEELHGTDDAAAAAGDPEFLLVRQDTRAAVNQALARLPAAFREVIVLKEIEELSYKEIALIAGIPIGTVMSRLSRGRKLLADYLGVKSIGAHDAMLGMPRTDSNLH